MTRSDRDPDAYDRIRDDKLTEQKPEWYVSPDVIGAGMNARLQEQAARIAELEAQLAAAEAKLEKTIQRTTRQLGTLSATKQRLELELAAATERERALINMLTFFGTELSGSGHLKCNACFQILDAGDDSFMTGHADGCVIVSAAKHDPLIMLPEAAAALAAAQPASDGQEGK